MAPSGTKAGPIDVAIRLLGRVEVRVDDRPVTIRSSNERALLARLALEPGSVVSHDALVAAIWPDGSGPDDPYRSLRYHVWHLRDLLEPGRPERTDGTLVLTRPNGYVLAVDPRSVDAVARETDWATARTITELPRRREALAALSEAWAPAAFGGDRGLGPLADAATRLDRLRVTIITERIAADIALGRDADLVPELEQLIAEQRFDERLRGQLMLVLYRAGRQADALAVYAATRHLLVEELGVDPGPELRDLEQQILRHDPSLLRPDDSARAVGASWTDEPRTNLPHPVDVFVGRDRELAELEQLLGGYRLVTLTGAGGIGKSRLALEAGRRMIDAYADGVWFVELAPVADEALVPNVVGEVWGLPASQADADEAVVAFLRSRRLLLVLDNCEHVLGAAAGLVAKVLREAPGVRILATSRESLGLAGESALQLPGLGLGDPADGAGDAEALFTERARAVRPGWDPTDTDRHVVRRICTRLDGIPLGLELAASRMRSMTPAEIADHLDRSLGMLTVDAKHAVPRHRTLAAAVEWSYRLLAPVERTLFRRCAVFAGGFDLAAAAALFDDAFDAVEIHDLMNSLVDKSLVVATPGPDGTRYRVLEPLRQWGHEQLRHEDELNATRLAHAHHYARLVVGLSVDYHAHGQDAALRRTLVEYANVRLALAALADAGDADRHLEVCFRLLPIWAHHDMHMEGFQTCRRSLELAGPDTDLHAQVKTAFVGAICGGWTRQPEVLALAEHGLELALRLGDPRSLGWANLALAVVHGNDGLPRATGVIVADPMTNDAMQHAADLLDAHPGPPWWDPTWERGIVLLCCSVFLPPGPERFAEFLGSRAAFQSVGDRGWLTILGAQALDHLEVAGPAQVRELLEEAATSGISPSWARAAKYRLGVLELVLGDHRTAIEELTIALRHRQVSGDPNWTSEARMLSLAECELGLVGEAATRVLSVVDAVQRDRGDREVLRTLVTAGRVLEAMGELSLAARAIGRADPVQDHYVDVIGRVRASLRARLGPDTLDALVEQGASSDARVLMGEIAAVLERATGSTGQDRLSNDVIEVPR